MYFRYRNLRWGQRSFGVLAPQDFLLGARARCIVVALLRFNREAAPALRRGELAGVAIGAPFAPAPLSMRAVFRLM